MERTSSRRWARGGGSPAALLLLAVFVPGALAQVTPLPTAFDWRDVGGHSYVGPVRDQGPLGTCYAFTAAAMAEGAFNVLHNRRDGAGIDFSEAFIAFSYQQLYPEDIHGENGASYAYRELAALVSIGVPQESAFRYTGSVPTDGNYHWDAPRTRDAQWYRLPVNDVETAQRALRTYGSLGVAVLADANFHAYAAGEVYTDDVVAPDSALEQYASANHAVDVVGWDNQPAGGGPGYWILRNSWGDAWGEAGYMRLTFNSAHTGCAMTYLRLGAWQGDDVAWTNGGPLTAATAVSDVGLPVARGFYAWGGTNSSAANTGSIWAIINAPSGFAQAHGMYLWAEGNSSMSNSGSIVAGADSGDDMTFSYGMLLQGRTLSNSGTIDATAHAASGKAATAYGMALYGYEDGMLTNTGNVSAAAGGGDGRAYALYAVRPGQVLNDGSLQAAGQTCAVGATLVGLDQGTMTNGPAGTIGAVATSPGGQAIGVNALRISSLTNRGSITATGLGTGSAAFGIVMDGSGAEDEERLIVNSGAISAAVSDPSGTAFSVLSTAWRTRLTLQTGSSLTGAVELAGADDVLRLEGAGAENARFDGIETLENAGNWQLSSMHVINRLILESGTLTCPDATVLGQMSGTGTLAGDWLRISGLVTPGNSIGTLSLDPATVCTFSPSSSVEVEVNAGAAAPAPGVNNDLIHVQGHTVIEGGTVDVKTVGAFPHNTPYTYTFLQADGGLDVASPWIFAHDWTFLDASLGYDATSYWLTLQQFSYTTAAHTPNQWAVAAYLDAVNMAPVADFQTVLGAIDLLDPDAAAGAFDQIGAQLYGSLAGQGLSNTRSMLRAVGQNLRSRYTLRLPDEPDQAAPQADDDWIVRGQGPRRPVWRGWAAGYGSAGGAGSDGNASAMSAHNGGGLIAMERELCADSQLGLYYGYGATSVILDPLPQYAESSHHQLGAYFVRALDDNYCTLAASIGPDAYSTTRRLRFGPIDRVARASYGGWQSGADLEVGRVWNWGENIFQPFAGLQYVYQRQDAANEWGADSLDLTVGARDVSALQSLVGLRLMSRTSPVLLGKSRWEARCAWAHECLDNPSAGVSAQLAQVGGPAFLTSGLDLGRDSALVGVGLNWYLGYQVRLFAAYDVQCTDRYAFHLGSGSLEYLW